MASLLTTLAKIIKLAFGGYPYLGDVYGKAAFGVIVPQDATKINGDVSQDYVNAVTDLYRRDMARVFGGYTATVGTGGWIDSNGVLVDDEVLLILSYCAQPTDEQVCFIGSLARRIKSELNQDCVSAIVAGAVYLVE